jgi:hypothetical protein
MTKDTAIFWCREPKFRGASISQSQPLWQYEPGFVQYSTAPVELDDKWFFSCRTWKKNIGMEWDGYTI